MAPLATFVTSAVRPSSWSAGVVALVLEGDGLDAARAHVLGWGWPVVEDVTARPWRRHSETSARSPPPPFRGGA